ncbi:MAG: hypothetical protein Q8R18_00550 [bacterium]|nr:hypothetical protein [bacterium]
MDWKTKKNLENKLGTCALLFILGIGANSCIYKPIQAYIGLTESFKEVFDFNNRKITDINNDSFLSKEEGIIRNRIYEECKSTLYIIGFAYSFPTKSLINESERILACVEEEYKKLK